jgi:hypothetical protein
MLATTDDLGALLRREIDEEDASAIAALDTASAFVEAYLGQPVELVEDDELILDGSGTRVILLPAWPVTEVSSVTVDEEALVEGEDFSWSRTGELRSLRGSWPSTLRSVEVVYSHGWVTIPTAIVGVVAAVAGRLYDSPLAVRQETMGSYSVTYAASGGLVIQAAEQMVLDTFKRGRP